MKPKSRVRKPRFPLGKFIILKDAESISLFGKEIKDILDLYDVSISARFAKDCEKVVHNIVRTYSNMRSDKDKTEYRAAADRHRKEISNIASKAISIIMDGQLKAIDHYDRGSIVFRDGDRYDRRKISPRSFWPLYHLLRHLNDANSQGQAIIMLRAITTTALIAKDFNAEGEELDQLVLNSISEISNGIDGLEPNLDIDWEKEINITLDKIKELVKRNYFYNDSLLGPFAIALSKVKDSARAMKLTPDQLKRSTASSGCTVKGRSVPSIIATAIEDLSFTKDEEFDDLVGYTPYCRQTSFRYVKSKRNYGVAIHSKKRDPRTIFILNNHDQDRLTFFENIHKMISKQLQFSNDGTFKQFNAANKVLRWMNDSKYEALYSLDLHAATNTLSIKWQGKVLDTFLEIFGYEEDEREILMRTWFRIMQYPTSIVLPHSRKREKFSFKSGQPMGYSDSFFSFAMLHHIAILTVLRVMGESHPNYVVLGDDSAVALEEDKDRKYPGLYKDIMAFLNTECNLSKGFQYNKGHPIYGVKIAEFAKFLFCNGVDISPIPLSLIVSQDRLTKLIWLCHHDRRLQERMDSQNICDYVGWDDNLYSKVIKLVSYIPLKNVFNGNSPLAQRSIGSLPSSRLFLATTRALLKQVIIYDLVTQVIRDDKYIPEYSDFLQLKKEYKWIFSNLNREDISGSKLDYILEQIQEITLQQGVLVEDILSGITPDLSSLDCLTLLLSNWDEQAFKQLVEFSSYLMTLDKLDGEEKENFLNQFDPINVLSTLDLCGRYDMDLSKQRFGGQMNTVLKGLDITQLYCDIRNYAQDMNCLDEFDNFDGATTNKTFDPDNVELPDSDDDQYVFADGVSLDLLDEEDDDCEVLSFFEDW